MFGVRKNKYDEKYVKNNYIVEYQIDKENKKIYVYYINGTRYCYPLHSKIVNHLNNLMKFQYNEWQPILKQAYMYNFIKLLYLNMHLKKQKYYLEHENEFNYCDIKKDLVLKELSKNELEKLKKNKKNTHSYFNLSSVGNYKLSTMKKVHRNLSMEYKNNQKVK